MIGINIESEIDCKKYSSIFAVGDIHGCADELEILLSNLPIDKNSLVVFLGDYIDRGKDSKGVVDKIIKLSDFCKVVALKGNHEMMLQDFLEHPESTGAALFILNGGNATLGSYATERGNFEIPKEHLEFYAKLNLFYETENYFFVHAGVPNKALKKIDKKTDEMEMLWTRSPFLKSSYDWGKLVIHGHSPHEKTEVKKNRINLDTGCVYGGGLTAMQLPEKKQFYVEAQFSLEESNYLEDENPRRKSHRFVGGVPVFIDQAKGIEFITLNYNNYGLLIKELNPVSQSSLQPHQNISGSIGKMGEEAISFEGEIIRVDRNDPGVTYFYGVRIVLK